MGQPKVSIVIPIYNVEPYLRECLDSVCRQTLEDIEIICVNDGSTDGSLAIVEDYAASDGRIVILDGPNGGYGKAMNRGCARATGEYVGIVEPDDYVPLAMYEDLYAIAAENDLDFVKADFYRFTREENGDMQLVYHRLDSTGRWYHRVFDPSHEPQTLLFLMNTWTGIYRRSFLEAHDIRHHETPGASFQDNGFWFQTFVRAKRAMIVDKPYYRYRADNPNSSVNDRGKAYCMNAEYDYIENLLRKEPDVWERFKYMFWLKRLNNYNFTMSRIDPSLYEEYAESFQRDFTRARDLGELDRMLFTKRQWEILQEVLASPQKYARGYRFRQGLKRLYRSGTRVARSIGRRVAH